MDYLAFSMMGWVHTIFGLLALFTGTVVILTPKRKRLPHRFWGYFYFFNMLATNVTALVLYELTGRFNLFHWFALFSLLTLILGMEAVLTKRRGWLVRHANFMAGSYIGVVLATIAEVTSRLPFWSFEVGVGVGTGAGMVVAFILMYLYMPQTLENVNPARARRQSVTAAGD